MSEDGIRVLSYFDLKYAIKLNRPRDPDAQSRISTISGISDGTSLDAGLDDDLSSTMTPPPALKAIVTGSQREVQGRSAKDTPLPDPPDVHISDRVHDAHFNDNASIFPPARRSSDRNASETAVVDMSDNLEDNHEPNVSLEINNDQPIGTYVSSENNVQPIEAVVTVANTEEAGPSSRQNVTPGGSSRGGASHMEDSTGRPRTRSDSSQSDSHRHRSGSRGEREENGSRRAQDPRRRQQQPSDKVSISKLQHRLHQQKIRTLQPPTKRKYQQNIDPRSRPNVDSKSRRPPLPALPRQSQNDDLESETPHTRRKRQSRRHCEICGKRYEGAARDIVVGYIPHCGHFYHCLCLDSYVRKHGTCPRCHYENKRSRMAGQAGVFERQISRVDVFFAFLADMLQDSSSEHGQSNTRGGVNNGAFTLPHPGHSVNRI